MSAFENVELTDHEHVSFFKDDACGLRAIVAIHRLRQGVSGGGIRFFPYADSTEALTDVLRLSRSMTYKFALAGLPGGGGKSVIIGDPARLKTEALLEAFGAFVHRLGGKYICAEDIGMTPQDMSVIQRRTPYVVGLPGKSGDTSPLTGLGVYRAIQAAADHRLGRPVESAALLGFGNVGRHLAQHLRQQQMRLFVADIDETNVRVATEQFGATAVTTEQLFALDVDVLAPCSIGAVLNDASIPRIKAPIVCGGANNQLQDVARHSALLHAQGVLFIPDYVANAGGAISGSSEITGWSPEETRAKVEAIYDTCLQILTSAKTQRCSPLDAAEEMARRLLDDPAVGT